MRHFSDSDLQDYFDGAAPIRRTEMEQHIERCPACRAQFRAYQQVFQGLEEGANLLPAHFSEMVIHRLTAGENHFEWQENALMLFLFAAGLAATFFLLDVRDIITIDLSFIHGSVAYLSNLIKGNETMVLATTTALGVFGLLDRFFLKMH